jgi:LuxR family maltose regulon positive regulatory protein
MTDALLAAKLCIPRLRAERVARPRLLERLDTGLARPLTLVSAPAGFGKTTLVAEWVATLDRPCAWLTLDERDSDPVRFLTYLIGALQQVESEAGASTLASLTTPGMAARLASLLPVLLNDIRAIPDPFVLVLDDYHLITGQAVQDLLAALIEVQPESMHLVLTSRADPPLPLARLRARGQLSEFRQEDLRFTPAEADSLLRQTPGVVLHASEVGALAERTEGWVAGLQMAGLALQSLPTPAEAPEFVRTFGGTHRHVADYLVEEVLAHLPDEMRAFLLQTSILERLSGPLCDAVLGSAGARPGAGQAMLEQLERANLFVSPLDDHRGWYRYHRLFADLLQLRLREAASAEVAGLHRRAAAWFASEELFPEAIQHALRAGDFELAATLVEQAAPASWRQGELATALGWLEALPAETRRAHPVLTVYLGTLRFVQAQSFARVEALIEEVSQADADGRFAGELAMLKAVMAMYRGDVPSGLSLAQQAVERIPAESLFHSLARRVLSGTHLMAGDLASAERLLEQDVAAGDLAGDRLGRSASLRRLGSLALLRGELRRAEAFYLRALDLSRDAAGRLWPVAGRILAHLADIALERNELDRAETLRRQAAALLERFVPGWSSETYVLLARLEHARGREAEASAAMHTAFDQARLTETSMDDIYLEILAARLAIWQGDLTAAGRWAAQWETASRPRRGAGGGDLEVMIQTRMFREIGRTTLARYRLARGEARQAIELLDPLLAAGEEEAVWAKRVELLALRALAHQAQGEAGPAQQDIEQALTLAEPDGFVRTFLEEGEPMARLLAEAARKAGAQAYARRLLGLLEPGTRRPEAGLRPAPADLVEPLTERELEVLRLLSTSLSTPEMADHLGVAPSTVRTFVKFVYGKLGVHRRLEAIDRARELGLIGP